MKRAIEADASPGSEPRPGPTIVKWSSPSSPAPGAARRNTTAGRRCRIDRRTPGRAGRPGGSRAGVEVHVVRIVESIECLGCPAEHRAVRGTVHHVEAGERRHRAAGELAADFEVRMGDHVHVRAERHRVVAGRGTSGVDRPTQPLDVRADAERDPLGVTGCNRDHSRSAGGHIDGHWSRIGPEPVHAARRWLPARSSASTGGGASLGMNASSDANGSSSPRR